jgi:hypothetical protein
MKKIILSFLALSLYAFSITFEVSISSNRDDAEERISSGNVNRQSSDLELVFDGTREQKVGMRFQNINILNKAIVSNAYIQFTVDEIDTGVSNVIIVGENSDDAQRYRNSNDNITNRAETNATVEWNISVWNSIGAKGVEQRSADVSSIIQEILSHPQWVSGNAMAFMIKAGLGCATSACQRTAESYNGSTTNAPRLHIEYTIPIEANLVVNYQMDECYWLNNSGTPEDVKDSSESLAHASAFNTALITENTLIPPLCNYGTFSAKPDMVQTEDASIGNANNALSVSFWINADALFPKWATMVSKTKIWNWDNGWGFVNRGNTSNQLTFFINHYNNHVTDVTIDASEGWVHIMGTYDKNTIRLYKNGLEVDTQNYNKSIRNANDPIKLAYDGDSRDGVLIGSLDEVKVWDRTLIPSEIQTIYNNEVLANNFDGSTRDCATCETSVEARTWSFLGISGDLRTSSSKTLGDIFDEFPASAYRQGAQSDGWITYKRTYDNTDNNSAYAIVPYSGEDLEFGKGYWLFSNSDVNWSSDTLSETDYNATHIGCVTNSCVEIDLETVNKNFSSPDNDPNDGSGKNRINMLGFMGKAPVDWADCRILVDGVAYTPSAAETAGYIDKQVWQYNVGSSTANANGYTTCDDLTPGGCKLEPYKAFWLILHGSTKNKVLKLLIPKE